MFGSLIKVSNFWLRNTKIKFHPSNCLKTIELFINYLSRSINQFALYFSKSNAICYSSKSSWVSCNICPSKWNASLPFNSLESSKICSKMWWTKSKSLLFLLHNNFYLFLNVNVLNFIQEYQYYHAFLFAL